MSLYAPPSCSPTASLDANETKAQIDDDRPLPDPPLSLTITQTFRHSSWRDHRDRLWRAMLLLHLPVTRLHRFCDCGSVAYVMQSDENPERYRVQTNTCHDRWCLPCARERASRIAGHIRAHIAGRRTRFLTLTLQQRDEPLSTQLDRLTNSFATLRRSSFWAKRVTGGCAMLEVKWSAANERWHPHLHLILEGRFLPHRDLKKLWWKITADSYIVHVRVCNDDRRAATYVSKYVSKPWTGDVERSPHLLAELLPALENRRLCHTYGTWRGLKLSEPLDTGTWTRVADLDVLLQRAKTGEAEALRICEHLAGKSLSSLLDVVVLPDAGGRDPPCQEPLWTDELACYPLERDRRLIPTRTSS